MPGQPMGCVNCVRMDYDAEDGLLPREFVEFDFAEDALDFENQLAEAREVKFVQTLTEPLSIGSHIICTGTPCEDLPWFSVNIGSGDQDTGHDVAVHFNVRLPQYYVVRNNKRHNKWGDEETTAYRPFPFKVGRPFTIEVLVEEKETLFAVDGEHYASFAHRNPSPLTANWVQVTGIRDATLTIKKTDIYPTLAPGLVEVPFRPSIDSGATEGTEPIWRPNVIALLPKGVPVGHQLVMNGRLRPLLHSFAIDLMDAGREWPRPNVHLHVNVRAYDDSTKERQLVVLNSWFGEWGLERRQRTAKLIPGTHATFRLVRGPNEWSIFANDILIGELDQRGSPEGVKSIRIRGDIYPEQIFFCPTTSSPIGES